MIKESEMLQHIAETVSDASPADFVIEYNRLFSTDLTTKDVDWDGGALDYEPAS